VTAGFIDLHSHGQNVENYAYKARDGVTTALELEVGVNPAVSWYAAREGRALVNFGATSSHIPARMAVMRDSGTLLPRDAAATRAATAGERKEIYEAPGDLRIGSAKACSRFCTHTKQRTGGSWRRGWVARDAQ
jgi:hypothetical protein